VSDIERGWVVGPKEAYSRLAELKQNGSKKEVIIKLNIFISFVMGFLWSDYTGVPQKKNLHRNPKRIKQKKVSCLRRALNIIFNIRDTKQYFVN